ncbi:hypothetical protein MMPV_007979 [Pyropia vietnamensis]
MATAAEAAPLLPRHPSSSPGGSRLPPDLSPAGVGTPPLAPADGILLVDTAAAVVAAAAAAAGAIVLAATADQTCDVPLRGWTHAQVLLLVVYCVLTAVDVVDAADDSGALFRPLPPSGVAVEPSTARCLRSLLGGPFVLTYGLAALWLWVGAGRGAGAAAACSTTASTLYTYVLVCTVCYWVAPLVGVVLLLAAVPVVAWVARHGRSRGDSDRGAREGAATAGGRGEDAA